MIWDDHQSRNIGELSFRSEVKAVKLRRDRYILLLYRADPDNIYLRVFHLSIELWWFFKTRFMFTISVSNIERKNFDNEMNIVFIILYL